MDNVQTLNSFWNSFGIKAYDQNTVPSTAGYPRITYEVSVDGFGGEVLLTASLWYYSMSWADITRKAEEIRKYIGLGGTTINFDDGMLWIKRGRPFAQRMSDPDANIRRILLNIETEFLSED